MSAGMPELGSKISLISKADIRYEGRLFTVDPKECTIALASVRSFGTEDRETSYPVPAQNQVYDYILFRGSDIKDIRVVNNVNSVAQPLNDPAIMQLSVPPSLGPQPFQGHPMLGHMGGPPMGQFAAGYGAMGGAAMAASVLDMIGGGSRSTTPASLGSRKSPTNDQGVQAGGSGRRDDKKNVRPIQPPGQRNHHHQQQQPHHPQQQQRKSHSQERRNSRGDGQQSYYYQDQRNMNRQPNSNMGRNQNYQGMHHQGGPQQHQQQHQQHHQQQQQQQGNQQRGGWTNRGPMRQRGRPRGGGFKPNQGQPIPGNKAKNTLKFENDYDFEQANTEFEELRVQLAKVKVEEGVKPTEVNGDVDKKDDSGNETGAGENEQEEEHEVFYDKTKSFFDKISCEAVERAKGKSQRTDWRTERKLNSETFGVAATRRGNFRGRGGFRGMGYRGGFRGGYRPQQQQQRRDQQPQQQGAPGGPRAQAQPQQQEGQSNGAQPANVAVPATAGGN